MDSIPNEPIFSEEALEAAKGLMVMQVRPTFDEFEIVEDRIKDPASLLPFVRVFEESGPEVERLPKVFQGRMGQGFFDPQDTFITG